MNVLSYIMVTFSILGAVDYILNNRFHIGKEWERGFHLMGTMSLSMIGMIVVAPFIAYILLPVLSLLPDGVPLEPSIIAGSFLANDMGGATLALSLAKNKQIGYFNGLVVGAMMGATISFTLPLAMNTVEKRQQRLMLLGMMCGIIAIPFGCVVAGVVAGISLMEMLWNLIPLVVLAILLVIGLKRCPNVCVKSFHILGVIIRIIITIGLVIGIVEFLTGFELLPYAAPIEEGALIIFNAAIVMSGAFPLIHIVGRLLRTVFRKIGEVSGMNELSTLGFVSTLATNVTTFGLMKNMDDKGVVLNSAFAVSGAFTFAGHLAFTMSFQESFVPSVILGKLTAGIVGVGIACLLTRERRI